MSGLPEDLFVQVKAETAFADPHRPKTVRLSRLSPDLQRDQQPEKTHENSAQK